jgi:endogenous inhibitor of DNA gyrase (YacG/DUF329 family)
MRTEEQKKQHNEYSKIYYQNNKERISEYNKKRYIKLHEENPNRHKEQYQKYRKHQLEYYQNNKRKKYVRYCVICEKPYHPTRAEYTTCSHVCGAKLRTLRGGKTGYQKIPIHCEFCGKTVQRSPTKIRNNKYQYCSVQCYWLLKKEQMKGENNPNYKDAVIKLTCPTCGKFFKTYHKKTRFCSSKCSKTIDLYKKGIRYERQLKKELEKEGYTVTRSAGSHGMFDLIAYNKEHYRLIQVKSTLNTETNINLLLKKDIKKLMMYDKPPNSIVELWCWRMRKGWEKRVI